MNKKIVVFFLATGLFSFAGPVHADVTGTLVPISDGSIDSPAWQRVQPVPTIACNMGNCYTAVLESVGGACGGHSDGDTTRMQSLAAVSIQSFDIDESSVPNGSTISNIAITSCYRLSGSTAPFRLGYCLPSVGCFTGSTITPGALYTEVSQNFPVSITKDPTTDIELQLSTVNATGQLIVSNINAVLTYTPPPTINANLTAVPDVGIESFVSRLTAAPGGSGTLSINYSLWWDCDISTTSVAVANATCGTLTAPPQGQCVETPAYGYKCDGVSFQPLQWDHLYNVVRVFRPKVIVEQGVSAPAESRTTVTVIGDTPPTVPSADITSFDYCITTTPGLIVTWVYDDVNNNPPTPGADPQLRSQVQVATDAGFTSLVYDQLVTSTDVTRSVNNLAYDTNYYVRVRVYDSYDKPSGWKTASPVPYRTPKHAYPQVNFAWTPNPLSALKEAQFADQTILAAAPNAWNWTWALCTGAGAGHCQKASSLLQNPKNTFYVNGNYTAKLKVTDIDGYFCEATKNVPVGVPGIPSWREVVPK